MYSSGRRRRKASASASDMPCGTYPLSASCADVWSVRTSGMNPTDELGQDVGGIGLEADRSRHAIATPRVDARQRVIETRRPFVKIACRNPALDALPIDFDDERSRTVHRGGERLCATHAAEASRNEYFSGQRSAEMATRSRRERFVGSLQNPLRSN